MIKFLEKIKKKEGVNKMSNKKELNAEVFAWFFGICLIGVIMFLISTVNLNNELRAKLYCGSSDFDVDSVYKNNDIADKLLGYRCCNITENKVLNKSSGFWYKKKTGKCFFVNKTKDDK